jgi:carbon storage regulator CsrA
MLVLSRKCQQSVVVGNPDGSECLLKVTVIEIRGTRIKLGFEAADHVPIQRSELWGKTPVADQPQNRPPTNQVAVNEALGRWEDDGGGKDALVALRPPVSTRPPDVTRNAPVLIEQGRGIVRPPNQATIGPRGFHVGRAAGWGALLVTTAVLAMVTYSLVLAPTVEVPAAAGVDRNAAVNGADIFTSVTPDRPYQAIGATLREYKPHTH